MRCVLGLPWIRCDMSPWLLGAAVMRSCAATPSLGLPSYHEKAQGVPVMSRHAPNRLQRMQSKDKETPMAGREARRENGSVCHVHSESAASVVARLEKSDQAPLFVAPQNRNNANASRAKGSLRPGLTLRPESRITR